MIETGVLPSEITKLFGEIHLSASCLYNVYIYMYVCVKLDDFKKWIFKIISLLDNDYVDFSLN